MQIQPGILQIKHFLRSPDIYAWRHSGNKSIDALMSRRYDLRPQALSYLDLVVSYLVWPVTCKAATLFFVDIKHEYASSIFSLLSFILIKVTLIVFAIIIVDSQLFRRLEVTQAHTYLRFCKSITASFLWNRQLFLKNFDRTNDFVTFFV